jgi:uncharacterized membrane protein
MTIGPVQFFAIGLENDKLKGEIMRELHRASDSGVIRVIDALAIQKTQDGGITSLGTSDLTPDQRVQYGAIIGGLIGLGATGTEEGLETGAVVGAETFAERDFGLSDEDIRSVAADLPPGTTAVFLLVEHLWAIPLKEAVQDADGVVLAQGMVRAEDLVALGVNLSAASALAAQGETSQQQQQLH